MLPISEQYSRSPCEVKSMDNVLILSGHIGKITEESIEVTAENGALPIVHCNTTVKICIFNNALGFRVLVGQVYLSTNDFIRITDAKNATDYEKRNFFRVRVAIPSKAYLVQDKKTDYVPSSPFDVEVQDLSLSGLFMSCQADLTLSDHLIVNILINHTDVSFLCKIIRKEQQNMYPFENGYGCEFLDNNGQQYDLLCKYLFDCQREQIRQIREKSQ